MNIRIERREYPGQYIRDVGNAISSTLAAAIEARGIAHLVLTGGTVGIAILDGINSQAVDWSRVHVWWGDERFVDDSSSERNCNQAAAFIDRIDIPAENIHRAPSTATESTVDHAAASYATELRRFASDGNATPTFNLTLLGMGPDAHIASLFPNRNDGDGYASVCPVRDSPKPPPERISLTYEAINASESVWLLVADPAKASALNDAMRHADNVAYPASCVHGTRETVLWSDDASLALYDAKS